MTTNYNADWADGGYHEVKTLWLHYLPSSSISIHIYLSIYIIYIIIIYIRGIFIMKWKHFGCILCHHHPFLSSLSYHHYHYHFRHHHHYHHHHHHQHHHQESVRLPDGNMIVMGKETFLAPEIMFQVLTKILGLYQIITSFFCNHVCVDRAWYQHCTSVSQTSGWVNMEVGRKKS